MAKKLFTCLAALLCLALLPVTVYAAGPYYINAGNITIERGTTARTVKVTQNTTVINNIPENEKILIHQNNSTNPVQNTITVSGNVTANITLRGVKIDVSRNSRCAFELKSGANVNLTLDDGGGRENKLDSGGNYAGIQVPVGSTLKIIGEGELTATGGSGGGAGIGSAGGNNNAGNITIGEGITFDPIVNAIGSGGGAGIGGGAGGTNGNITINGFMVSAQGGARGGAGIGRGNGGSISGVITINKGIIEAVGGGSSGVGIGGSRVTFRGESVIARSTNRAIHVEGRNLTLPSAYFYWVNKVNTRPPERNVVQWPGGKRFEDNPNDPFKYVDIKSNSSIFSVDARDESGGGCGNTGAGTVYAGLLIVVLFGLDRRFNAARANKR